MLFATICHILRENEIRWFYLRRKEILSTENDVRPNRDDNDHVLIITMDVDQISARHDDIKEIIYSPVPIKFIILNITYKQDQIHEKWQIGFLKFGSLIVRDSKMREGKMLL
jgi:hypothetical protein